jgi:hypothetical protein
MQNLIVTLVVALCSCWVCWTLAPRPARRWLALRLLALPGWSRHLPLRWQANLQRAALTGAGGGCACDASDGPGGCQAGDGSSQSTPTSAVADWKPVQWTVRHKVSRTRPEK